MLREDLLGEDFEEEEEFSSASEGAVPAGATHPVLEAAIEEGIEEGVSVGVG